MKLLNIVTAAYLFVPLMVLCFRGLGFPLMKLLMPGCLSSLLRLPLLAVIGFQIFSRDALELEPLRGFLGNSEQLGFSIDHRAFLFLSVLELGFFVSSWMIGGPNELNRNIKQMMFLPIQFLLPSFVLTSDLVLSGCILILLGPILFYLLRLSESAGEVGFAKWAPKFYRTYIFIGLSLAVFGIYVFSTKGIGGGAWGQLAWIVLLLACCPFPLWARWFFPALEKMGFSLALAIVCIHSTLLYKMAGYFSLFSQIKPYLLDVLFAFGFLGCLFSLWSVATQPRLLAKFVRMFGFLYSIGLMSVSLGGAGYFNSIFQISIYLPLLAIISMYIGGKSHWRILDKSLVVMLSVFYLGLPGTPLFLIFSEIGGRSLAAGKGSLLLFSLLWLTYFVSVSKVVGHIRGLLSGEQRDFVGAEVAWPAAFPRLILALVGLLLLLTYLAWRV